MTTETTSPAEAPMHSALWRFMVAHLSRGVDHSGVHAEVHEQGGPSGRYIVLTALSAAIATLGLLLSSPAVIIGAMLLSPLMGPIMLLGLSFWMVDWASTRRAVGSLALGFGIAFAVATLLTLISPLKEPTAEILARTRPNLFDLLVAIFSGIAGGYAVVRRRGETVIGVAIATALMPPIATIGFGVGVGNWSAALGALLLFTTNLIAIALAAAGVAAVYGFKVHDWARRSWLGNIAVLAVLAGLCVPLTLSLQTIARESEATAITRRLVGDIFGTKSRLSSLTVREVEQRIRVEGLVATPRFIRTGSAVLARQLTERLHVPVDVALDQVVIAHPERLAAPVAPSVPAPPDPATLATNMLRQAVPFATRALAYDPGTGNSVVVLAPDDGLDLHAAHRLEMRLRQRPEFTGVIIEPPVRSVAPLTFDLVDGNAMFGPDIDDAAWALRRWNIAAVNAHLCHAPRAARALVQALLAAKLAGIGFKLDSPTRAACLALGVNARAIVLVPA